MKGSRLAGFSHIDIHFSFDLPNIQLYAQQNTGISARDFTTSSNMNEIPSNEDTSRDIELQRIHNSESGYVSHDDEGSYSYTQQATGRSDYSITGRMNETVNALKESGSRSSSVCSSKRIDSSGVLRPSIFRPFTSETGARNQDSLSQTQPKHSGHHISRSLQRGVRRSPSPSVPRSNPENPSGSKYEQSSTNNNSSHPKHNKTGQVNDKGSRASSPRGDGSAGVNEPSNTHL